MKLCKGWLSQCWGMSKCEYWAKGARTLPQTGLSSRLRAPMSTLIVDAH